MYRTIVVGTDGSATATEAVRQAATLTALTGGTLVVVSAFKPVSEERLRTERVSAPDDVAYGISPEEEVDGILDAARQVATDAGVPDVKLIPVDSAPADALLDAAERARADLIVVGSQGMEGAKRFLLGSVPNRISHHAPCDVLIVKTDRALASG